MYDRKVGERVLSFEASGALMDASLVMRDRETDSWWSIMTSTAIGGALEGAELVELPVGVKTTWADWVERHPRTLVLSVDGKEHEATNPYEKYLASERTFRGLEVEDDRLSAKTPIYSFWLDGKPYAVAHGALEGGRIFEIDGLGDRRLVLYREPGAPLFASTEAYLVAASQVEDSADTAALLAGLRGGLTDGAEKVGGFDTFWYNWIAVNEGSELLR